MFRLFAPAFCFLLLACLSTMAGVNLTPIPDTRNPSVLLQWNMVDHSSAAYTLLKSIDGVVYCNPVTYILNLSYKRNDKPRGVINAIITDAADKIVVRFRQASNNKQLSIPVSNLHSALYFIKIKVLDDMQMIEKFVKL